MSMQKLLSKNIEELKLSREDYTQGVTLITKYMAAVGRIQKPPLNHALDKEVEFDQCLLACKESSLAWVNNVLSRLVSVPESVHSYDEDFLELLKSSLEQTEYLIEHPNDQTVAKFLKLNLKALTLQMSLTVKSVESTVNILTNFHSNLPYLAENLKKISLIASDQVGVDKGKLNDLAKLQEEFNKEIDRLTLELVALGIADAASIGIGVAGFFMPFPANVALWFFGGIGAALSSYYIVLDSIKIVDLKAKIEAAQRSMDSLTADVSVLQCIAENVGNLANRIEPIKAAAQLVLSTWETMLSDFNASIADVNKAISDGNIPDYEAVRLDLTGAINEWELTNNLANMLTITMHGETAEFKYGMSKTEVDAALAKGGKMEIISYLNSLDHKATEIH